MYPNTPGRFRRKTWMKCSVSLPRGSLTNLWKSTFRCTMNLSRMRTRRSRIMTRMKTTPKSCPFWAARLPRGLVLNRWAKPTATWYTIHLQQTSKGRKRDVFEVIVSGRPDGNDRVKSLIDTYLSAFHRRMSERSAESPSPQGSVPTGFDVREFV